MSDPKEQVGGMPIAGSSPKEQIARLEEAIENAREWQVTLGACEATEHSTAVFCELTAAQRRINLYRERIMHLQLIAE